MNIAAGWPRCAASSLRSPTSSPCSCRWRRWGRCGEGPLWWWTCNSESRHSLLLQTDHRKRRLPVVVGDYERVLDASIHQSQKYKSNTPFIVWSQVLRSLELKTDFIKHERLFINVDNYINRLSSSISKNNFCKNNSNTQVYCYILTIMISFQWYTVWLDKKNSLNLVWLCVIMSCP